MKKHLAHSTGHLNVDADNLYFTKSGNWEECARLKSNEIRFKPTPPANAGRSKIILIAALIIGLASFVTAYLSWNLMSVLFGAIVVFIGVTQYLNQDGPVYFISRLALKALQLSENQSVWTFKLSEGNSGSTTLVGLSKPDMDWIRTEFKDKLNG